MSLVKVSALLSGRIDAECYRKEFLQLDSGREYYLLKDLCQIQSGTTPPDRDDKLSEGVVLLKTADIRNAVLNKWDADNFYYISPEIASRMQASQLKSEDVLINIVGATTEVIGRVALVPKDFPEANITQAMAFLRVTNKQINPAFLFSYLAGKHGNKQVRRYARPTGQFNLNLQELGRFQIPLPAEKFQIEIEKLIKSAHDKQGQSKQLYAEAQSLLAAELGLDKLDLSGDFWSVQHLSDVKRDRRIDAEHFLPKYTQVIHAIKALNPRNLIPLGELVDSLTNGQTPLHHNLSIGDVLFLMAQHVRDFQINLDTDKRVLQEHYSNQLKRTQLRKGDLLITIKGRIGNAAVAENLPTPTTISQDVALLRLKPGYHPYYIAAFLNSIAGKAITEQISTGQINPFLSLVNLRQVLIPLFETERMNELGEAVQKTVIQAHQARRDAQRLLEEAKAEVERLIEQA